MRMECRVKQLSHPVGFSQLRKIGYHLYEGCPIHPNWVGSYKVCTDPTSRKSDGERLRKQTHFRRLVSTRLMGSVSLEKKIGELGKGFAVDWKSKQTRYLILWVRRMLDLIVEKYCSNVLKTIALASIFVKVRSFSFNALTSLFGH